MNQENIQVQLNQIEQNITNIELMPGFSAEQLQMMLTPLQEKRAELKAMLETDKRLVYVALL